MAAPLGKALGPTAESWLAMQTALDLWEIAQDLDALADVRPVHRTERFRRRPELVPSMMAPPILQIAPPALTWERAMGPEKKKVRRTLQTKRGKKYDGLFTYQAPIPRDWNDEVQNTAERCRRFMDAYLPRAREYAGEVLRKAGLPDTLRHVQKHPDGTWTELPEAFRKDFLKAVENLPDGESIKLTNVSTMVYAQDPAPDLPDGWGNWTDEEFEAYFESLPPPPVDVPAATNGRELTPEWFACQVLERADILEADLARGDAMAIAVSGIQLGEALNALLMTDHYELATVIGWKQLKDGAAGGKRGGRPRRATPEVAADLQRQADKIWGYNPKRSVLATAQAIKKKNPHGPSVSTIRRCIRERRPKNS